MAWTQAEDAILTAGVEKYGTGKWHTVAALLPSRTTNEVRNRYFSALRHTMHFPWNREYDRRLTILVAAHGQNWATIGSILNAPPQSCMERSEILENRKAGLPDSTPLISASSAREEHKVAEANPVDLDIDTEEAIATAEARMSQDNGRKAQRKLRERMDSERQFVAAVEQSRQGGTLPQLEQSHASNIFEIVDLTNEIEEPTPELASEVDAKNAEKRATERLPRGLDGTPEPNVHNDPGNPTETASHVSNDPVESRSNIHSQLTPRSISLAERIDGASRDDKRSSSHVQAVQQGRVRDPETFKKKLEAIAQGKRFPIPKPPKTLTQVISEWNPQFKHGLGDLSSLSAISKDPQDVRATPPQHPAPHTPSQAPIISRERSIESVETSEAGNDLASRLGMTRPSPGSPAQPVERAGERSRNSLSGLRELLRRKSTRNTPLESPGGSSKRPEINHASPGPEPPRQNRETTHQVETASQNLNQSAHVSGNEQVSAPQLATSVPTPVVPGPPAVVEESTTMRPENHNASTVTTEKAPTDERITGERADVSNTIPPPSSNSAHHDSSSVSGSSMLPEPSATVVQSRATIGPKETSILDAKQITASTSNTSRVNVVPSQATPQAVTEENVKQKRESAPAVAPPVVQDNVPYRFKTAMDVFLGNSGARNATTDKLEPPQIQQNPHVLSPAPAVAPKLPPPPAVAPKLPPPPAVAPKLPPAPKEPQQLKPAQTTPQKQPNAPVQTEPISNKTEGGVNQDSKVHATMNQPAKATNPAQPLNSPAREETSTEVPIMNPPTSHGGKSANSSVNQSANARATPGLSGGLKKGQNSQKKAKPSKAARAARRARKEEKAEIEESRGARPERQSSQPAPQASTRPVSPPASAPIPASREPRQVSRPASQPAKIAEVPPTNAPSSRTKRRSGRGRGPSPPKGRKTKITGANLSELKSPRVIGDFGQNQGQRGQNQGDSRGSPRERRQRSPQEESRGAPQNPSRRGGESRTDSGDLHKRSERDSEVHQAPKRQRHELDASSSDWLKSFESMFD